MIFFKACLTVLRKACLSLLVTLKRTTTRLITRTTYDEITHSKYLRTQTQGSCKLPNECLTGNTGKCSLLISCSSTSPIALSELVLPVPARALCLQEHMLTGIPIDQDSGLL
jgi:hypothetical protein